jgi:hypothetical protein
MITQAFGWRAVFKIRVDSESYYEETAPIVVWSENEKTGAIIGFVATDIGDEKHVLVSCEKIPAFDRYEPDMQTLTEERDAAIKEQPEDWHGKPAENYRHRD